MSRTEHSDTYRRESDSRITHREFLLQGMENLTLLNDTFMMVALKDIAACQHVIRILMDDPTIEIVEVRTQYRVSRLVSKDSILDILAEDSKGRIYNLEIQRKKDIDHARRTRLYGAMVDSEHLEKGKDYDQMPEVYVIYISETNLWKTGHTEDSVRKHLDGQKEEYDDGLHILYINAAIDDGTEKAALMRYFKTCDPEDMSQGALSHRVHYLKREEGGINEMCEYSERIYNGGKEEGIKIGRLEGHWEGTQEKQQEIIEKILSMKGKELDEKTVKLILNKIEDKKLVTV